MKQFQWFALAAALLITAFEMLSVRSETRVARDVAIDVPALPQEAVAGVSPADFRPAA